MKLNKQFFVDYKPQGFIKTFFKNPKNGVLYVRFRFEDGVFPDYNYIVRTDGVIRSNKNKIQTNVLREICENEFLYSSKQEILDHLAKYWVPDIFPDFPAETFAKETYESALEYANKTNGRVKLVDGDDGRSYFVLAEGETTDWGADLICYIYPTKELTEPKEKVK